MLTSNDGSWKQKILDFSFGLFYLSGFLYFDVCTICVSFTISIFFLYVLEDIKPRNKFYFHKQRNMKKLK